MKLFTREVERQIKQGKIVLTKAEERYKLRSRQEMINVLDIFGIKLGKESQKRFRDWQDYNSEGQTYVTDLTFTIDPDVRLDKVELEKVNEKISRHGLRVELREI